MAEKFKLLIEYGVKGKSGHWGHKSQPGHRGGSLPKDGQGSLPFPKRMKKTTTTVASVDKLLQKIKDNIVKHGDELWKRTKNTVKPVDMSPEEVPGLKWDVGDEHGFLINIDGSVDKELSGTHNQMEIPDDWDMEDKVFLHTHPSSEYFEFTSPLSWNDLFTCIAQKARVVSVTSSRGTVVLARKDGPNPIDKHWGVTPQGVVDAYDKAHQKFNSYYVATRDRFHKEYMDAHEGKIPPREFHLLTMKATHLANFKVFGEVAKKFGWTYMYVPKSGYKKPDGFDDVNPWRVQ